jgi:homoserine kinase
MARRRPVSEESRSAGGSGYRRRRCVRVPATSANLGPGFDCMAAALALALEVEVEETGHFAVETELAVPRGRENLCVRAFERLHPADGFTFRITSQIPLSGGLGSSAAATVAGLMAADHLFELDADLLALAGDIEGHPDNVAAALYGGFVVCAEGQVARFDAPTGLEALVVVPEQAVRTKAARAALPAQVPMADAVFNVAHAATLTLGLARGDWDLLARGLDDRLHQGQRARLFPRSFELARRARQLGALGATISGAGPTVLVWCFYEQTGAVAEALAVEIDGWASLLRVPFEAQGAYVDAL